MGLWKPWIIHKYINLTVMYIKEQVLDNNIDKFAAIL